MKNEPLVFACREVEWELWVEPSVLRHLAKHRQAGPRAPEVGGQLFAAFEKYRVRITRATGPRETDRHSRFSFFPDRRSENSEIKERFVDGLHFVGDWHTHPERHPSPSTIDLASMADCFRKSKHSLSHFVMLIVGQDVSPAGLWVSLHNAKKCVPMKLMSSAWQSPTVSPTVLPSPGINIALVAAKARRFSKPPFDLIRKALGLAKKKK